MTTVKHFLHEDSARRESEETGSDDVAMRSDVANGAASPSDNYAGAHYATQGSLIVDRLIARVPLPRTWVIAATGLILLAIPLVLAYADGLTSAQLLVPYRSQFIYPFVIVYILLVFDALEGTRANVAYGLRPLIRIDDEEYAALVDRGCRVSPAGELIALGSGLAVSIALDAMTVRATVAPSLLERYAHFSSVVMMALDVWFIYVVFAMTRLTNTLLRQPMHVDVFDISPFEPIGRQTVWMCLTFVGSLLFGILGLDTVNRALYVESLIFFGLIVVIVLAVFYVNTHNVHNVLSGNKRQRLDSVNTRLAQASTVMEDTSVGNQDAFAVALQVNALAVIKQELKATRTWPYNTEMLRTLVISIVTPLVVGLSRVIPMLLATNGAAR